MTRSETGPAEFSPDRRYRYTLTRRWQDDSPLIAWIGLNPSTADEQRLDPTLRRIRNFSREWGYGGFIMLNLFAWRSTAPDAIKRVGDPVGPMNDVFCEQVMREVPTVVAAWGVHGNYRDRDIQMMMVARNAGVPLFCLGTTKEHHPRHPLYVPGAARLEVFSEPSERG